MGRLLYIKMKNIDNVPATFSRFDDSIKFTYGDEVYVFDLEGRPIFMYFNSMLYERGLSGEIVEKKWVSFNPPRRHLRRIIDWNIKRDILEYTFDRVEFLVDHLGVWDESRLPNGDMLNRDILSKLRHEEETFRSIYRPISILPPDQYLSLVLQPIEGCPYNKCSFCTFYRDREFRYKDIDEFRSHVASIVNFLGQGIKLRRRIFLADANALYTPYNILMDYIKVLYEQIPSEYIEGIYSFSDYFTVYKKYDEFKSLRELGLKRVYIGLESGSDKVLKVLSKPGPSIRAVKFVNLLKEVGISVAVIVLIGAGGYKYYEEHVSETVKILNMMRLDSNDIIYYSKLKIHPDSQYAKLMDLYGLDELDDPDMDRQINEIRNGLKHINQPIHAIYDIDETIY